VSASELLDAGLTSDPARVDTAARRYIKAVQAERQANKSQQDLESESLRSLPNVTQDQIDQAGRRVKAARLTAVAALAVLEQECDR
jgi:Flp pilus assembly protein TadB